MTERETAGAAEGRPTRPRGDARRRQILDVAFELFGTRGFNSVGIAEIAAQVGITQAGLLHHFPSKAALLLAVLQEREQRNLDSRAVREAAGMPALDAYISTLQENDERPELVRLFVILAAESTAEGHPGHEWFIERNAELMRSMEARVKAVIDERKLPDGVTTEVVTRWLLGLAHGLGAQWVFDPDEFRRAEHVGLFLKVLEPYFWDPPSG